VTDTNVLNDPQADDVADEIDVADAAEDNDPETLTGEEVSFDLEGGA
jgi:hypothetical protein